MSVTSRLPGLGLTLSFICLFNVGCIDTSVTRLGQHKLTAPAGTASTEVVHEPGVYRVKWVASKERSGTIEGSERWLLGGDRVGFSRTQEGTLLAIAGKEQFPLDTPLPKGARRVVWYAKHEEPSDLTKATGTVLGGAGSAIVVGGVLVGVAVLESALHTDDCDDDDTPSEWRQSDRQDTRHRGHYHRH